MTGKENTIYKLNNIRHSYDEFTLKIPEFSINAGTSTGLSGPNGSGKSTLLRILALLETPDQGAVLFNNKHNSNTAVTLLQQDPYLLKRSVFDNVSYGLMVKKEKANLKKRAAEALEVVSLDPDKFMNRRWFELSGGEAQRVALASRIILKPAVLLLDEPVANVDIETSRTISEAIKTMQKDFSTTLVITSHDITWLTNVTDKIWKMHNGRITGTGNINIISGPWLKNKNNLFKTKLPGGENIFAANSPGKDAVAILQPEEIMIAEKDIENISAMNKLMGTIKTMYKDEVSGDIRLDIEVSGKNFTALITETSAIKMNILPGKNIHLIFKATSLIWA